MPEVTDPALLEMLNGGTPQNATVAPTAAPGIIMGRPKAPPTFTPPSGYQGGPSGLAPIPGGPADPNTNAPPSGYRYNAQGNLEPIPGGPADKSKPSPSASAADKLVRVIDQIDQIYADSADNGGWFETGGTGALSRKLLPTGTAAFDLGEAVKTIDANMAFDELQKMRENSPTGGALGGIAVEELNLLKSTVANLNPDQSQEQFVRNLATAKGAYIDFLKRVDPAKAEEILSRGKPVMNDDGTITYDTRGADALQSGEKPPATGQVTDENGNSQSFWQGIGAGVGDIVQASGDMIGLATNPVGQVMYNAMGIDRPYDTGRILRDATGLPNGNETVGTINRFAASGMLGGLGARAVGTVTNPGTVRSVLDTLGASPVRDAVAGAGAGAGSVLGRESGMPGGEYVGALAGGMAGYGAANTAMRAGAPRAPSPIGEAAARQGVDLLPADVSGPAVRGITTATKASPISVGPVVRQAQENSAQLGSAARRVAQGQGELVTTDVAGDNIRRAGENYSKQTRDRFSRLYDRAHKEAQGVRIKPLQTIAALDARMARLQADPSAPPSLVNEITAFRDNIANGVSVQGLRDARTRLSEGVYDGTLRSSSDQAAWKEVLGNLSSDIELGLRQAGRGRAADLFKRADEGWKQRVEHIDEVLQPLVGRDGTKSGEQVLQAIETMTKGGAGGNARLSRLLGNMSNEEAGQVRGVLIDRLGKATPGAQDAAGEAFSPSTFLTNWNRMTPQAKASLFSDRQLRKDMNDLAVLADGMKGTRAMENFSNTAMGVGGNVGAGLYLAANHPVAAILGAGAQYATGKLMASPGFARILARNAKLKPEVAARRLPEQLGVLVTREPAIANDARALQDFLRSANDNGVGVRASASDRPEDQGE